MSFLFYFKNVFSWFLSFFYDSHGVCVCVFSLLLLFPKIYFLCFFPSFITNTVSIKILKQQNVWYICVTSPLVGYTSHLQNTQAHTYTHIKLKIIKLNWTFVFVCLCFKFFCCCLKKKKHEKKTKQKLIQLLPILPWFNI